MLNNHIHFVLWGLAREMLSCCLHCWLPVPTTSIFVVHNEVNLVDRPQIEIIDAPILVEELKPHIPIYVQVNSGSRAGGKSAEFTGWAEFPYVNSSRTAGRKKNWFDLWLRGSLAIKREMLVAVLAC